MKIGEILRYPSRQDLITPVIDGLSNWYHATRAPIGSGLKAAKLDSGINSSAVFGTHAHRVPYVAIRSSPHRFGSSHTPWEDIHRPDQGFSRYFGDAKPGSKPADAYLGNQRMLNAFLLQRGDKADRLLAPPILVFEAVPEGGRVKGQVLFHGLGLITRTELVVQREPKSHRTFPNYVYEIALLDLATENDDFDWQWINQRRAGDVDDRTSLALAPASWRKWVERGPSSITTLRRNVITRTVVSEKMQKPPVGSPELKTLREIYSYYGGRKHRFEALAEFATEQVLSAQGVRYKAGWITQGGSDGGFDFVGSIDLDPSSPLATSRQVILGQAKCEKLTTPTNGLHIARLAARLRRGWVGVYVTTSYFSIPVQREVLSDRYPIVMIDGYRLATVVNRHLTDTGMKLDDLLSTLTSNYESRIGFGDPETVLM